MASFCCNGELAGRLSATQHRSACYPRVQARQFVSPQEQRHQTLVTAPALALIQSRANVGINLLQEHLNMFQFERWPIATWKKKEEEKKAKVGKKGGREKASDLLCRARY